MVDRDDKAWANMVAREDAFCVLCTSRRRWFFDPDDDDTYSCPDCGDYSYCDECAHTRDPTGVGHMHLCTRVFIEDRDTLWRPAAMPKSVWLKLRGDTPRGAHHTWMDV